MKKIPILKKLLFSFMFTLILLEVSVRIYSRVHPSVLAYHPTRYQKLKARPGDLTYGFAINSDGFKDQPFSEEKAPDEFRVAAIGDSFVFSMVPYEKSFCTVLEKMHTGLNVMNFGIIGTGPEDYVTVLKTDVLKYSPDAVLLFIYEGNDFLPGHRKHRKLYEYSAAATVIHHTLKAVRSYKGQDIRQNYTYRDDMTPFTYEQFVAVEAKYAVTFSMSDKDFRREFARRMQNIDAIIALCDRRAIPLYVLTIPDRLQLEAELLSDVAATLDRQPSEFNRHRLRDDLSQAMSTREVPFYDMFPILETDNRKQFINNDIHLNIWGNELVAKSIPSDWLTNMRSEALPHRLKTSP
jgi:hypothetical protein